MGKKPEKKEEPKKDTVQGYSGSPHEGEKPNEKDPPKGHVVSPLGVTKPTPVIREGLK